MINHQSNTEAHEANQNILQRVQTNLLEPSNLSRQQIEAILNHLLRTHIDYADLYFQSSIYENWRVENGIVKESGYCVDRGVGVRAIHGEKTGFSYTNDIALPKLIEASQATTSIVKQGHRQHLKKRINNHRLNHNLYQPDNPLTHIDDQKKIALIQHLDQVARQCDPSVKQVIVTLAGQYETVLIMATDGTFNADIRPLVRLDVSVIVEQQGRRESGSCGGGGRFMYDYFLNNQQEVALNFAHEAVRQAIVNLNAKQTPAGLMPVVLGPGWPGVMIHEAVGHGLEGDFNRKASSAFCHRLGEQVASSLCTIVDDGTLQGRRGSLNIDDDGIPTQHTVLIENGILKNYMQDKFNAHLMGMKPTGNGRRQSYAYPTLPRMTNTYMQAGRHDPKEIIASVDKGLYAVNFGGGQVDITNGKFVFQATEAYLIEKGNLSYPVKGVMLIGDGPSILHKISMVGNDLQLDSGVGICGKEGQNIPVGVGQPTLLIDELTVGGTTIDA